MTRSPGRTQPCTAADAQRRLQNARRFLEVAELLAEEGGEDLDYPSQSASMAVLSGIAAADAACCHALGQRFRGQDHRGAARLLAQVRPDGKDSAKTLNRLLDVKDEAQYGFFDVSGEALKATIRQSRSLLEFAEQTTRR
jgi:hypothetical protein